MASNAARPESVRPRQDFQHISQTTLVFPNGIHYLMETDEFEWDDGKAEVNRRKHKISFRAASRVFDDPLVLIEQDLAADYGEDRFVAVGRVEGLLITVVFTERGERVRIISARKANSDEQRAYDHS